MGKINCTNCGSENSYKSKYCIDCGYELPKVIIENKQDDIPVVHSENMSYKKKAIIITSAIFGLIIILTVYFSVQRYIVHPDRNYDIGLGNTSIIDKQIELIAKEANKSCPVMTDAETRLDRIEAAPGKILRNIYTLINYDKSQIDTTSLKEYIIPNIVNMTKTHPQFKFHRDNKLTMEYIYNDKNGEYIMSISIKPNMYE
jgi:uncharacterized membrane protein YvbJ